MNDRRQPQLDQDHPELAAVPEERMLSAAVFYEDDPTRDRAILVCQNLERELRQINFEFSWWKFKYLADPFIADAAADTGAQADLVIFSAHAGRQLPPEARSWIERWLAQPAPIDRGALVALIGLAGDAVQGLTPIHVYLREIAQRAKRDYLPCIIESPGASMHLRERASESTPLLQDILHQVRPVSHWGINE